VSSAVRAAGEEEDAAKVCPASEHTDPQPDRRRRTYSGATEESDQKRGEERGRKSDQYPEFHRTAHALLIGSTRSSRGQSRLNISAGGNPFKWRLGFRFGIHLIKYRHMMILADTYIVML
jgi:hypothetical protein